MKRQKIGPPVPELPVADVERAQQHYREVLGFEIGWLTEGKEIGAVSRGDAVIFFRKKDPPFEPGIHWIFAEDIDNLSGTPVVRREHHRPPRTKAWGIRQFTVQDLDGNLFYFHNG